MVAHKNIIRKVQIGVNTPSLENGQQLKDGLDVFFKDQIFPEMDNYFNSIQKGNSKIIRIENISIEISIEQKSSLNDIQFLIMKELREKINYDLISEKEMNNVEITSSEKSETEAFLYFLKNGTLPWWFEDKPNFWGEFIKKIGSQKQLSKKLKPLIFNPEIRKRLIFQFDDAQLFQIISSVLKVSKPDIFIVKTLPKYRYQFWEAVLHFSIYNNQKEIVKIFENIPRKDVLKLLQISKKTFGFKITLDTKNLQKDKLGENEKAHEVTNFNLPKKENETDKEGVLIRNAGLILLHPFIKMFFEKMDFLSGKVIKSDKIDEAIHLLHYLATGKELAYEHELVFEKFLCNIPIHQPINRHISLSKEQKIACEVLLQAVLGHWSALKSNSTEIIQNEFLQREGKLIIAEEKQTLIVQRKTQDILLEKLPWNIHLIKIPWKEKILFVEW
ncbi:MAG: contractile injection system tape measure protein [Aequorivita sp.]|nr:contractile injection system tape measure protein [Aequorivita sp.]